MIQFKRFFIFIYLHLILTVLFTYLGVWIQVKNTIFKEDYLNVLMGVLWLTLIYMVIGLFWGSISPEKKKLLLPMILYVILLSALLVYSIITQAWLIFLNGYIPFTYFIRNIGSRDLFVLLAYACACILPSVGLYLMFKLGYTLSHLKDKKMID